MKDRFINIILDNAFPITVKADEWNSNIKYMSFNELIEYMNSMYEESEVFNYEK